MIRIKNLVIIAIVLIFSVFNLLADWEVPETGTTGQVNSILENDGVMYAGSSNGVFISINKGKQWIERSGNMTNKDIQSIVSIGNVVYVGTYGAGVYMTTNKGEKWIRKNDGLGNLTIYDLAVEGDSIYAVTDEAGIFMSKDKGETWFSLNNGDIIGIVLYTIEVKDGKVFVGGQFGDIYTTTDYGLTWENIKSGDLFFDVKSIDFKDNKILAGTSSGVFISKDNGQSWKVINTGLKNTNVTQVAFHGDLLWASTKGGGVFISDNDGLSWIPINEGIPGFNVFSLGFSDEYVYAGFQFNPVTRRLLSEISVPEVEPPTLVAPPNDKKNVDTDVTFIWRESQGAMSYLIQVALSDDFTNPIFQKDNVSTTTVNQEFEQGLTYYWRVAANTADGQKKWSEVWSFTTREEQTAPVLLSPADKSVNVSIPIEFIWSKATGTDYYKFQLATDEEFKELITNKQIDEDTSFVYENLEPNTLYYWRVFSVGFDGNEMNKGEFSFTTGDLNSVDDYITDNDLVEIYPNPVADVLSVEFKQNISNATVELISAGGIIVSRVYKGVIHKGMMLSLDKQIARLVPGLYFIRVSGYELNTVNPFVKY